MRHSMSGRRTGTLRSLCAQFGPQDGLPFINVLSVEQVEQAFRDEGIRWRDRILQGPRIKSFVFFCQGLIRARGEANDAMGCS
jgi:hypothetical protein